jgi:hypothetical protein
MVARINPSSGEMSGGANGFRLQYLAFLAIVSIVIVVMLFHSNGNRDAVAFTIAFILLILGYIFLTVLLLLDGNGSL